MNNKALAGSVLAMLWLLAAYTAAGQPEAPRTPWRGSIGISAALSRTGYSAYLLPAAGYRRHTVYAGPKLLLDDSYLPYKNTWGINAGYACSLVQNDHWQAGAGVDYQCSFYKPYNPYNLDGGARNRVQELNLLLGLAWRARTDGRLAMGMHLGSGLYFDTYHDLIQGKRHTNIGRGSMIRFTVTYNLF